MIQTEKNILLVDDEERLLNSMAQRISLLGFTPIKASSGQQALDIAETTPIDLAIIDLKMPEMDGLVTITKLKEIRPALKTVLLTGYGSEKTRQATEALGSVYIEKDSMGGLWDLIKKSSGEGKVVVINPPSLETTSRFKNNNFSQTHSTGKIEILDAADHRQAIARDRSRFSGTEENRSRALPKIIGETSKMQRLKKNIERFSDLDCPIIIRGETGTGKELAARTIHRFSDRKNQRFLAFDCGCFSNDFQFNELVASFDEHYFSNSPKHGTDQENNISFSGTILLDHIENMPDQAQNEMMKLLIQKTDQPGTRMDIRFIAATQQHLKEKVKNGDFRQDLYHRIRAIELEMPALRERREDLRTLCRYFLSWFNEEFQKEIKTISEDVYTIFETYSFPGNIRELRHIIERSVILSDKDTITADHLPERFHQMKSRQPELDKHTFPSLSEVEEIHIIKAIEVTKGNKSEAAKILGISRAALWRKLRIISDKSGLSS